MVGGYTMLMTASGRGLLPLVKLLLRHDAKVDHAHPTRGGACLRMAASAAWS